MPASLNELDASIVRGMLLRGDRQHDIASWFGVNAGRVAEVKTGAKHATVTAAPMHALPPPGPYSYFTRKTAASSHWNNGLPRSSPNLISNGRANWQQRHTNAVKPMKRSTFYCVRSPTLNAK